MNSWIIRSLSTHLEGSNLSKLIELKIIQLSPIAQPEG